MPPVCSIIFCLDFSLFLFHCPLYFQRFEFWWFLVGDNGEFWFDGLTSFPLVDKSYIEHTFWCIWLQENPNNSLFLLHSNPMLLSPSQVFFKFIPRLLYIWLELVKVCTCSYYSEFLVWVVMLFLLKHGFVLSFCIRCFKLMCFVELFSVWLMTDLRIKSWKGKKDWWTRKMVFSLFNPSLHQVFILHSYSFICYAALSKWYE